MLALQSVLETIGASTCNKTSDGGPPELVVPHPITVAVTPGLASA